MEISISRKSWHYRMTAWCWDHLGKEPSKSLCGYFWQMLFAPVVVLGFYGILLFVALIFISFAFYISGAFICDFLHWINVLPASFDVIPGQFNWRHSLVSVLFNASLISFFAYKHFKKESGSGDNVVFAFIKAKKRKICPLIEFKD